MKGYECYDVAVCNVRYDYNISSCPVFSIYKYPTLLL